jgi:hypothetical protein
MPCESTMYGIEMWVPVTGWKEIEKMMRNFCGIILCVSGFA